MSKTWTIVMYSAIGVVTTAAVFVAGHVVGTKKAAKSTKPQAQDTARMPETAQA